MSSYEEKMPDKLIIFVNFSHRMKEKHAAYASSLKNDYIIIR